LPIFSGDASGELTETAVASGIREVAVTKEGFAPYYESVTVVSDQTSTVNAVLAPEDLDGDGLLDIYEKGGYLVRDGNAVGGEPRAAIQAPILSKADPAPVPACWAKRGGNHAHAPGEGAAFTLSGPAHTRIPGTGTRRRRSLPHSSGGVIS